MKRDDSLNDSVFHTVLLDTLPEAITMVNREGIVQGWNLAAAKLYGIPPVEIIGRRVSDFFQRGSLMLFQVMDSGLPVYGVYHRPCPDKHVFIDTVPVRDKEGDLIGAISIERDITDVVKLSQERFSNQEDERTLNLAPLFQSHHPGLQTTLRFLEQIRVHGQRSALLISGESGVGKTILARYTHQESTVQGPFVTLACHVVPEGYLDIELFGHHGDVYGDERDEKIGKLELASLGTLFLTSVEALPPSTQVKLAKAIQDGGFTKNGGAQWIPLTCRVIAATSELGERENTSGQTPPGLLPELYFQFHEVFVPPLRDRREDLPTLCHSYLAQAAERLGKPVPELSSEVMAAITTYPWPGNIRELVRVMEHLIIVSDGDSPLTLESLPRALQPKTMNQITHDAMPLGRLSEEVERAQIENALAQTGGNKASTARLLGISRGSLYYKMRQYKIK